MYLVKNISLNRKLVFTLPDNTTVRVYPGQTVSINDNQISRYLENLSKSPNKLIVLEHKNSQKTDKKSKKVSVEKLENIKEV